MQKIEQNYLSLVSKFLNKNLEDKGKILDKKGKQSSVTTNIDFEELEYFKKLTNDNFLAQCTIVTAIYSFLLKKLLYENDECFVANFKDQKNSLLLSFPIDLKLSFKEYLEKVKLEVLEALNYTNHYNDLILEKTGKDGFNFLSNFSISINSSYSLDCNGVAANIVIKRSGEIEFCIHYLEGFVKKIIVERLVEYFRFFIVNLENNIEVHLVEYPLLSEIEKHQLLSEFNNTKKDFPSDKSIINLFESQVLSTPDNISLIYEGNKLTYKDLNEKANQLSHYLSSKYDLNKGDIIGVLLPKSDKGIISLLAILKLGAVYLPLDTNYPRERIDYLIKDSGLKLLISYSSKLDIFPCPIVDISLINFDVYKKDNINKVILSTDLAYIIYTSGSTGQPKGVMVDHRSNVNMSLDQISSFEITSKDKVVWFASVSFDASISEIMMSFYSGAILCIPTEAIIKDKKLFIEFIKETKSTVATFPPSYLGLLSEKDISGLRCIITAGESANASKAHAVVKSGVDYYNAYGPTECAVCVSFYKVAQDDINKSIIPIGRPISNTNIYILDDALQPQPIGVPGKLYVSGVGVARGYLNRPELTLEKFILNPFAEGERMYDTGDLGCWSEDGNIEFLGRIDQQVKIRGYRIELGEIENTVLQYSEDLNQVVAEVKEINKEKVLVAYLVSNKRIDKTELRNFLKKKLPNYMIPGFYIELENLPLTHSGKINRKALPNISENDILRKEYLAPRNETEKSLILIWQEVLGVEKIGVKDNFFDLGGHSLMVAQVNNRIYKKLGKKVTFKTFFATATIEKLSKRLQGNPYASIPKAPELESYDLTASQSRIWILSQLEGGSLAYNMPSAVKLEGSLNVDKFEESFRLLVDRHEILRTCFKINVDGEVRQHVLSSEKIDFKIDIEDYRYLENQQEIVDIYLQDKNSDPFDLEEGPLVRGALLRLEDQKYVFFLSMHHIIGDGWSMELLTSEIIKIYNGLIQDRAIDLPKLSIQYKDYAVWLNKELLGKEYQISEQYWLNQFKGDLPVLDLPSFKLRPLMQTYNGQSISHEFSKDFLENLKRFSKQYDVTLFMTLMGGVNALLHRYTGHNDIILGTPSAGRDHPDLENQIGLYLNTLAIRTQFEPNGNFLDLIAVQKENLLSAYEHQGYPFDALVGKLNLKRDTSRSALFDVMVVLQNQEQLTNLNEEEITNLQVGDYSFSRKTSQFDINFNFYERNGLYLVIDYNTDIYDEYLIKRIFVHLENLLKKLIVEPTLLLEEVEYLTEGEKKELLIEFNDTEVDYPRDKTIIDLFEDQVFNTPDNIAVVFENTKLTYQELNEKSNQLANYLLKFDTLSKGDFVGISVDRSEFLIIALLAVLKAGYAYVLIDTSLPLERFNYILSDSKSKLLIDNRFIEKTSNILISESKDKPNNKINLDDIVYLMYTSGSTGRPKGAINIYQGFTNTVKWYSEKIKERDRIGIISNLSFDLTQKNYFAPLIVGASIYIDSDFDPVNTRNFIKQNQITVVNCAPSLLYSLLSESQDSLISLKKVILGGESIKLELIKEFLQKFDVDIFNSYGPSEASDVSAEYQIKKEETDLIPIGKPIRNTKIFILDKELNQLPVGIIGEICIGGIGLGLGYLNNEESTKDKFIYTSNYGNIYKSGDLGRWLPDGNIEFLGRRDQQVKIRGYRIELGEIEACILKFSEKIIQVAVEAKEINNDKVLVAYVVSTGGLDKTYLRAFLHEKLPDYMVPNFYVSLESLPLTPSGKVDRKALPDVDSDDIIRIAYVSPRNLIETHLTLIWQEVLGIEKIGVKDNFFDLGGHSLMVVQVINRIYKQLGNTISFKTFFASPTIEKLSKKLQGSQYASIPKAPELESYPLTASQSRFWILSQMEGGSLAYNMPSAVLLEGVLDVNKFEESFRLLIHRHEILRTCFKTNLDGEVRQHVLSSEKIDFRIGIEDYRFLENQQEIVDIYLQDKNSDLFDLEQGPLLRVYLLRLEDQKYVFFLSMHHIIGDGWSMELLTSEIIKTYNKLKLGMADDLPLPGIQYKDYAVWLNKELLGRQYEASEQYWLNQFKGDLPALDVPSFKLRPLIQTYNGKSRSHVFSKDFLENLKSFSKEHDVTLFMTLMAGVNALLYRYTGQNDIILGTPSAGRDHPDLENQIGLYLNTLAIRTRFEPDSNFLDLVGGQKETLLDAYEHQVYPFDALVGKLNLKRDTSRSALFDVVVVLQNQEQLMDLNTEQLTSLEVKSYPFSRKNSQFDLRFAFAERSGLQLMIDYNTDIYDEYLIKRIFAHFENLLGNLIAQPTMLLEKAVYLTEEEQKELLIEFNDTKFDYPRDKTIIDLFEDQVSKTPDNIAVVFEKVKLTYKELNKKANQLAHYLREEYSIEPNDFVGIKLDRSEKIIIGILGILKSGAAYVPIDPVMPIERINYIAADANCKVILDEDELEIFNLQRYRFEEGNLDFNNEISSLAYLIYTSGTTGRPKGVMVENSSVIRLVKNTNYITISDTDQILNLSNFSFDGSIFDFFGALLNGATIIIPTKEELLDLVKLESIIIDKKITLFFITTALFNSLVDLSNANFEHLRCVLFGGESTSVNHVNKFRSKNNFVNLVNVYGPTENTTFSTYYNIENKESTHVPIGKPISNTYTYILNDKLSLIPIGAIGKLYVSGDGLSRGYLNQPELTNEKFISNPFIKGQRLYDTGDLCRWLPDGNIEFIGRKDQQVKIRGFRIELEEIENAILQYSEGINQVVVEPKGIKQDKVLVAYLVSEAKIDKSELKDFLEKKLPDYMVPNFYIVLHELPLTPNGKVDRKALPGISSEDVVRIEFIEPNTSVEKELAEIWREILGIEKIGITDNFFELGGDSIRSIRLLSKINKSLEVNYKLSDIYELPSIRGLLSIRFDRMQSDISPLIKGEVEENFLDLHKELNSNQDIVSIYPMSDIELGMLYSSFLNKSLGVYHDQFLFPIPLMNFDINIFVSAVELLVEKHDMLRTAFNIENYSIPVHLVYKSIKLPLEIEDLSTKDQKQQLKFIEEFMIQERTEKPFDINVPGLWRMKIYKLGEQQWQLLFQFHHAILDGWSLASLITELNNTYINIQKKGIQTLEKLSLGYKDYVFNQECIKKANTQYNYWESKLKDYSRLDIFTDEVISNNFNFIIEGKLYDALQNTIENQGLSMKMINFSAYLYTLQMLTYNNDVTAGIVTNGRPILEDGDNILGCFLNTVPFRLKGVKDISVVDYVKEVNHIANTQKRFEGISLYELQTRFSTNKYGENPFFDTFFNYIDFHVYDKLDLGEIEEVGKSAFSEINFASTNTFLDLTINPESDRINVFWRQQRALKGGKTIENLHSYYLNFLQLLAWQPNNILNKGSILCDHERVELFETFNDTKFLSIDKTIVDLFEEQVGRTPHDIAVVFGSTELTYKELNEKSNQLAGYLREKHSITCDDLVGIKLERNELMIIALFGVLKSGAAYVPIDLHYPKQRIAYIEKDSNSKIIIDQVELARFIEVQENYSRDNVVKINHPNDLAYVIYTSGTTGNPKGVMVEHRNTVELINWSKSEFDSRKFEVVYAVTSYCFDLSIYEIFYPLSIGKKIRVLNNALEANSFTGKDSKILLNTVPSVLRKLFEYNLDLKNICIINLAGEVIPVDITKKLQSENIEVRNLYGPSEDTTYSTCYLIENKEYNSIPIGKPIANTQVYLLDDNLQPIPAGVAGKIYISGTGLTRGYLNKPELTSERFIVNPFLESARMYDTGDLGRWLPDGTIEFLGRNDHQVKIRGYRIELGEIENAVLEYSEDLKQAIVDVKEIDQEKILVVYLISNENINKTELRNFLCERLPHYMIPAFYIELENLPLTPNGKIDRSSLPSVSEHHVLRKEYVAPRNETEERLILIWQEVLGIEKVGVTDNFFELGGDSLKIMKLVGVINDFFSVKLTISDIFYNPDIASIFSVINELKLLSSNQSRKSKTII